MKNPLSIRCITTMTTNHTLTFNDLVVEYLGGPEFRAFVQRRLCEQSPAIAEKIIDALGKLQVVNPDDALVLVIPYDQRDYPDTFYHAFRRDLIPTVKPPDMDEQASSPSIMTPV